MTPNSGKVNQFTQDDEEHYTIFSIHAYKILDSTSKNILKQALVSDEELYQRPGKILNKPI